MLVRDHPEAVRGLSEATTDPSKLPQEILVHLAVLEEHNSGLAPENRISAECLRGEFDAVLRESHWDRLEAYNVGLEPHQARRSNGDLGRRFKERLLATHWTILMSSNQSLKDAVPTEAVLEPLRRTIDAARERTNSHAPLRESREFSEMTEVDSIRYFAEALAPRWARLPVSRERMTSSGDQDGPAGQTSKPPAEEFIERVEELLALEGAKWVGGAMARIWTLIGFLVTASIALLFAITSYPFPEQPRAMALMGMAIAALMIVVLRVVMGSNRDEVISRIGDTQPGKVSWDASLFSSLGAYVVPLVGMLAAISFDLTDLFRSVFGPILRLFP
jgi:hypothetical protein